MKNWTHLDDKKPKINTLVWAMTWDRTPVICFYGEDGFVPLTKTMYPAV